VLVLEYCQNSDIYNFITFIPFNEATAKAVYLQIIKGLEYCHSKGIIHRDLKTENILLDEEFTVKICDFGWATEVEGKFGDGKLQTKGGTPSYNPPEVVSGKIYTGAPVDVFMSGVMLFVMSLRDTPFDVASSKCSKWASLQLPDKRIFWNIKHSAHSPSAEFKDLMEKLLMKDPADRIALSDIPEHPWFKAPIFSEEELRTFFIEKAKAIQEYKVKKAEKARKEQEIKQMYQQMQTSFSFTGVKPKPRGLNLNDDNDDLDIGLEKLDEHLKLLEKEEQIKLYSLNNPREAKDYYENAQFKPDTEYILPMTPIELLKNVIALCCMVVDDKKFKEFKFTVNPKNYKIRVETSYEEEQTECNFGINILRMDNELSCVEFVKTEGEVVQFHDIVKKYFKPILDSFTLP
jgi:serine/threonine protein kinase